MIALLRDPVDRAYSHYHHELHNGTEPLSFEEAIEREAERLSGEWEKIGLAPTTVLATGGTLTSHGASTWTS